MFYVYLLLLKNGEIYKGVTADLKRRIKEHKLGKVTSTKNKRPLSLIHYEAYLLKSDASRREKFLKTTEGRRLLKQQLKNLLSKINAGSPGHPTWRPVE
jgi:putative endonuclease